MTAKSEFADTVLDVIGVASRAGAAAAVARQNRRLREVTPEMIEAGLPNLYRFHADSSVGDEETVTKIYLAMLAKTAGNGG